MTEAKAYFILILLLGATWLHAEPTIFDSPGKHTVSGNELQTAWVVAHDDGRVEVSSWDNQ